MDKRHHHSTVFAAYIACCLLVFTLMPVAADDPGGPLMPLASTTNATPSPAPPAPPASPPVQTQPISQPPALPPLPPRAGTPVRVRIPVIGVDAAVEQVATTPDGAMDVPKDFANTAWYTPNPRPGELGNAVIAGHVDSASGTAVFWDLRKLHAGDEIRVVGDDNVERRFVVRGWETYAYNSFPLDRVFGTTSDAHLNLITCDQNSGFNSNTKEYAGNLVVYADYAP